MSDGRTVEIKAVSLKRMGGEWGMLDAMQAGGRSQVTITVHCTLHATHSTNETIQQLCTYLVQSLGFGRKP